MIAPKPGRASNLPPAPVGYATPFTAPHCTPRKRGFKSDSTLPRPASTDRRSPRWALCADTAAGQTQAVTRTLYSNSSRKGNYWCRFSRPVLKHGPITASGGNGHEWPSLETKLASELIVTAAATAGSRPSHRSSAARGYRAGLRLSPDGTTSAAVGRYLTRQIPLFKLAVVGPLPRGSGGHDKRKNPANNQAHFEKGR